jgi:hypothetical protein
MEYTQTMLEETEIHNIYENAKKDPSLFSTLDIEKMLSSVENEKNDYLENKTTTTVTQEIYEKLSELPLPCEFVAVLCKKLIGYRYVDEIHELHKGKVVSWIRIRKTATQEQLESTGELNFEPYSIQPKLTGTGIVVNIKFSDKGTNVVISNPPNQRFTQYRFDDCYTFQKMSEEEQLILMAYEYLDKNKS